MTAQEFEQLILKLEKDAALRPRRYRLKLLALAALGHAYVLSLLMLTVGAAVWALIEVLRGEFIDAGRYALLSSISGALLYRATRTRQPEPAGQQLLPADTPQLFAVIDKIRTKVRGPRIHRVVINDEFNAAIFRAPRLGILGWHRNTLIIGLPLMQALSRKDFAAILAHEYGHLSREHGRLDTWIYHTRMLWEQVQASFHEDDSVIEKLLTRFLRWYIPLFQAYSFVQARRDEYEADRIAAKVLGQQTIADALVAQAIKGRFVEERFWKELWRRAEHYPQPPFLPHATMRTALNLAFTPADAKRWFDEALLHFTSTRDTHPCLRDRILNLDASAELPPEAVHSAAQSLLGNEFLGRLQDQFDQLWLQHNEAAWRLRYHAASSAREIVQRMEGLARPTASPEELAHYALALETLGRDEEALPLLRAAADHPHGTAEAAMAAARLLCERNDEALTRYLELAVCRNRELSEHASQKVVDFFTRRGEAGKARLWREKLARRSA